MSVFLYLVADTDWSLVKANGDESCCNNIRLLDVLPGLTPWYSTQPQYKLGVRGGSEVWITGGAHSFGARQKVLNVANLQFELISERTRPRFHISERGPLVRRDGFQAVDAAYSVEGEMNLYEVLMDSSFE